jgi:hypothetical protein
MRAPEVSRTETELIDLVEGSTWFDCRLVAAIKGSEIWSRVRQ